RNADGRLLRFCEARNETRGAAAPLNRKSFGGESVSGGGQVLCGIGTVRGGGSVAPYNGVAPDHRGAGNRNITPDHRIYPDHRGSAGQAAAPNHRLAPDRRACAFGPYLTGKEADCDGRQRGSTYGVLVGERILDVQVTRAHGEDVVLVLHRLVVHH